jgi:hypothetical protein
VANLGTAGFEVPALPPPSFVNLFSAFSEFLFGFQNDALNAVVLSLWPVAVILGLLTLGRERLSAVTQYFITSILFAFAFAFAASFLVAPVFLSRYLIFTIPAFYLVISSMFRTYAPRMRYAMQAALVVLMIVMLAVEITNPRAPVKEAYAEASAFLASHATVQDTILLSAPFTIYPIRYYYRGPAPVRTLPTWDQFSYGPIPAFDPAALPDQVAAETDGSQNVYVLLSHDQGYEDEILSYFDSHYDRLYEETFSNKLAVYVYRLRYDTGPAVIQTDFPSVASRQ